MTNTEIKNQLIEIQKNHPESILWDICEKALTDGSENLIAFLLEEYGDITLRNEFDKYFFAAHPDEIELIRLANTDSFIRNSDFKNRDYVQDICWFAYQIVLQNLLIELELLTKEDAHF